MLEKNQVYEVEIIDDGYQGEGIAKIDNFPVFIQGAIKGEKVEVKILKVQSSFAYGKIIKIIKTAKSRVEAECTEYKRCGGCNLRHIDYKYTLQIKKAIVDNAGIDVARLVAVLGKSRRTVERAIARLKQQGVIEYRGSKKTGGYYAKG